MDEQEFKKLIIDLENGLFTEEQLKSIQTLINDTFYNLGYSQGRDDELYSAM